MADEIVATFEPSAGLHALAAKSRAAGLDVKLIFADGRTMDISYAWACVRASQFSHLLDRWAVDPARHSGGSDWLKFLHYSHSNHGELFGRFVAAGTSKSGSKQRDAAADIGVIALDEIKDAESSSLSVKVSEAFEDLSRLLKRESQIDPPLQTSRDLLKDKAIAAIVRLVEAASESTSLEALSAPDEVSTLINFLASPEIAGILASETRDPLAAATARGVAQRKALLEAEGGTASGQELAEILGISRQAVDKRRRSGTLLAVPNGSNDWRYPRWQILGNQALPGFEQVMKAFGSRGAWTRLHFLLSPNERFDDERPIDLLRRGDVNGVIEAVIALGEEGAR